MIVFFAWIRHAMLYIHITGIRDIRDMRHRPWCNHASCCKTCPLNNAGASKDERHLASYAGHETQPYPEQGSNRYRAGGMLKTKFSDTTLSRYGDKYTAGYPLKWSAAMKVRGYRSKTSCDKDSMWFDGIWLYGRAYRTDKALLREIKRSRTGMRIWQWPNTALKERPDSKFWS